MSDTVCLTLECDIWSSDIRLEHAVFVKKPHGRLSPIGKVTMTMPIAGVRKTVALSYDADKEVFIQTVQDHGGTFADDDNVRARLADIAKTIGLARYVHLMRSLGRKP